MMKEMVYGGVREQEVIYSGEYKGFDIAIVNRTSHPCAYIRMPDDMVEKLKACHPDTYDDYDSYYGSVHGGYTYCSYGNLGFEELKTGLWLGWDYAHLGDYYWTSGGPLDSIDANGKKWTVGEILANAFEAVDTLEFDDQFSRTKHEDCNEDRDYEEEPKRETGKWIWELDERDPDRSRMLVCSICGSRRDEGGTYNFCHICGAKMINPRGEQPPAQPEIIRCKDCKHYRFDDSKAFGFLAKRCERTGFEDVGDDDFCSRAERRCNFYD